MESILLYGKLCLLIKYQILRIIPCVQSAMHTGTDSVHRIQSRMILMWEEGISMIKKWFAIGVAAVIGVTGSVIPAGAQTAEAAAPTTVYYGSENGDVWDLQARLNQLGYKTELDGIYGLETESKVIRFQTDHGLRIDGIAGPETWSHLKKQTEGTTGETSDAAGLSLSKKDKTLMARAVYGEARGEPYKGKVAVAAVILNRIQSDEFPDTVRGVIMESGAFTAVSDGQIWLKPDEQAYKAVQDAINGWDPSGGATYYFNPDTATSDWIWSRTQIDKIGKHIFSK
ncbi:N-acetylmuramoyl-L-alanine amidase [Melghirimyces thermohalophilus]|mgnify:CR=1 FL=1|uniref:Spore cortex-lytic enzyme n=2 Tax=Melghirimyces thermohalophilus TaxID=1236220 RepID=A0A1G6KM89_9BACL|nr:N-acetylmuramoyl-L-alanine amidase [Melghirimyces thermohalophilus]